MAHAIEHAVGSVIATIGPGLYAVACSGGADSMALAAATIRVAGAPHVVVLTIDHGLAAGSAVVCEGVAAWARGQGAAAVIRRVVVERRASVEAAARDARYAALHALVEELGVIAVLVGHTARDQAETVLLRIVRGTGPAGLVAIPRRRGHVWRPLLALEHAEVEDYVAAHALPTWHDPMNDDSAIARVRARRELLPLLRRENPQVDAALIRLAASAAEWLEIVDAAARPFARLPVACGALAKQPVAIRKRAISLALEAAGLDCEAVHLEAIDRLVTAPERGEIAVDVPGARLVRSYGELSAIRNLGTPARTAVSEARTVRTPAGEYVMRTWQPGDRMRPARLKGRSRKLSDLYIDAKIPRATRAAARVLVSTPAHVIVWAEHIGIAHGVHESALPEPGQMGGSFWG